MGSPQNKHTNILRALPGIDYFQGNHAADHAELVDPAVASSALSHELRSKIEVISTAAVLSFFMRPRRRHPPQAELAHLAENLRIGLLMPECLEPA